MFLHAPTVIRIRRLLYAIILGRTYSIRSGTNNYFYRSCQFRFEYINVFIVFLSFFFFFVLSFGFLSVFCSSNVSIDEGMFGVSIGASKIGLGEFRESNGLFVMMQYLVLGVAVLWL
jgi:hypothetical protein